MATHEVDQSSVSRNDNKWRENIISQLHERNKIQTNCFSDLITLHNRLFENVNTLRGQNMQLAIASESNMTSPHEAKLRQQTEELTALHRKNAEHMQQILDLNKKMQDMVKELHAKEKSLAECKKANDSLHLELKKFVNREKEYETLHQVLNDEHQALQIAFESLEKKLRKAQEENLQLVECLKKYKERDAEKLNEENDNFLKKRQAKVQRELEDAARDFRPVSPDKTNLKEGVAGLPTAVPTKVSLTFSAHEGEVYAVKWSPVDRILATGGVDRKVKLWSVIKGTSESKGILVGSNAGVMSVDFDSTGTLIIGASNDFVSRVWTVSDLRIKHTLTGHCGKVMAAKFLGEPSKVVTGSHDRTLKIWDLRNKACIETKFAGSSCNDLVTSDGAGSTIISGHFDQKIRFWDTRAEKSSNDLLLEGRVTSLDLSRDTNYLLSCVRDDTVKLIDLRMKKIIGLFSADGFKVGFDWARAAFSPDGQYIAAGSSDGSVYIWSVSTNMLETVLKNHSAAVTAVSWYPHGTFLASVDRAKTVTIWGDHV